MTETEMYPTHPEHAMLIHHTDAADRRRQAETHRLTAPLRHAKKAAWADRARRTATRLRIGSYRIVRPRIT